MKTKRYSKELKLEVVTRKLKGESTMALVREFEISTPGVVRRWMKQYQNGNITFEETRGKATKATSPNKGSGKKINIDKMTDQEYIKYLEMEVDVLKKISEVEGLTGSNKYVKYKVIRMLSVKYPVTTLCSYLNASTSTYYLYLKRNPDKYDTKVMELVKKIHQNRNSCGYRTIQMILFRKYNLAVNHKKITRIMRYLGIKGKQYRRKYKFDKAVVTSKIYGNIINRDFKCTKSNQKWSIDITYIPNKISNTYLVCIKDLFDKRIVNFKNSNTMSEGFVQNCLIEAFESNNIKGKNLILHSDQGSHFSSKAHIKLLNKYKVVGSHSRRGNCHENAPIESFFSIFKREAFNFKMPTNFENTIALTEQFIKYYNNERCQLQLNKKTPCEYYSA
jgi:transposase InsO family protein/transposase-like protein